MEAFFVAVAVACVAASVVTAWFTLKGLRVKPAKWEPGTLKELWR